MFTATGAVDNETRRARRGPERSVHERLRGHLAKPVVKHAEALREAAHDRHLLRRVAGHDLCVLLVGRLPAHLRREDADVVGHEAVHARHGAGRWRVPGHADSLADLETVLLFEAAEQLDIGVEVLLARVGVRSIHIRRDRIRDRLSLGAVLGPPRDRVAQTLPDHALENLALPRPIKMPQEVVQRPVLEQHHNHMVHRVRTINAHRAAPSQGLEAEPQPGSRNLNDNARRAQPALSPHLPQHLQAGQRHGRTATATLGTPPAGGSASRNPGGAAVWKACGFSLEAAPWPSLVFCDHAVRGAASAGWAGGRRLAACFGLRLTLRPRGDQQHACERAAPMSSAGMPVLAISLWGARA